MEFDRIMEKMERLIDSAFDRSYLSHLSDVRWTPAVDVYETGDSILVVVELPGTLPEDIEVAMHGNVLLVSGVRTNFSPPGGRICHHMEMHRGRFFRKITIDTPVGEEIEVGYDAGLLRIKLFKL
jgi:HSP20 family protein